MHHGFATLIGLLIAALIMIFMMMVVLKTYTKNSPTSPQNAKTQIQNAQDAVDKYQQKAIENQKIDLEK